MKTNMKQIKSLQEWSNQIEIANEKKLLEQQIEKYEALNEDDYVDIDIMLDSKPDEVESELNKLEGVDKLTVFDFGVIKAKVKKKIVDFIRKMAGVEDVEVIH